MTDKDREAAEKYANQFVATPRKELAPWQQEIADYFLAGSQHEREKSLVLLEALRLIAAPKRNDGTYNRGREACEQLALEAIRQYEEKT